MVKNNNYLDIEKNLLKIPFQAIKQLCNINYSIAPFKKLLVFAASNFSHDLPLTHIVMSHNQVLKLMVNTFEPQVSGCAVPVRVNSGD